MNTNHPNPCRTGRSLGRYPHSGRPLRGRPHRGSRLDTRGFTMMEILVALIVIGIGVFSLTALIPAGTRSNSKAGQQTRGSELAAVTMERLLSTPYNDPDLDPGAHTDPGNPFPGNYYVTWNVDQDQPIAKCKRITVETHWPTVSSSTKVRLVGVNPQANDEGP